VQTALYTRTYIHVHTHTYTHTHTHTRLHRLQPVLETRKKQVRMWIDFILSYQKHFRKSIIGVNEDAKTSVFANTRIDRMLLLCVCMCVYMCVYECVYVLYMCVRMCVYCSVVLICSHTRCLCRKTPFQRHSNCVGATHPGRSVLSLALSHTCTY